MRCLCHRKVSNKYESLENSILECGCVYICICSLMCNIYSKNYLFSFSHSRSMLSLNNKLFRDNTPFILANPPSPLDTTLDGPPSHKTLLAQPKQNMGSHNVIVSPTTRDGVDDPSTNTQGMAGCEGGWDDRAIKDYEWGWVRETLKYVVYHGFYCALITTPIVNSNCGWVVY